MLLSAVTLGRVSAEPSEPVYTEVSLIRLIANPEKYDGKPVMIEGVAYLDSKDGINAIFLTREDKRAGNGVNGIFLIFSPSISGMDRLNDRYVFARGIFRANMKGHLDSFSASLTDVTLIKPLQMDVK